MGNSTLKPLVKEDTQSMIIEGIEEGFRQAFEGGLIPLEEMWNFVDDDHIWGPSDEGRDIEDITKARGANSSKPAVHTIIKT